MQSPTHLEHRAWGKISPKHRSNSVLMTIVRVLSPKIWSRTMGKDSEAAAFRIKRVTCTWNNENIYIILPSYGLHLNYKKQTSSQCGCLVNWIRRLARTLSFVVPLRLITLVDENMLSECHSSRGFHISKNISSCGTHLELQRVQSQETQSHPRHECCIPCNILLLKQQSFEETACRWCVDEPTTSGQKKAKHPNRYYRGINRIHFGKRCR